MTFARKTAFAALAVGALALSVPTYADARGPGWGGVAAGVVVGSVLGAAAASAAPRYYYDAPPPAYIIDEPVVRRRCWYERQIVDTDYGPRRVRVRVCEP